MAAPQLSIIVPVYNEAENILQVFDEIQGKITTPHEVLVVYDFDGDTTVPVVQAAMEDYHHIHLVKNTYGPGALEAIRTGFDYSKGKAILVTMADLSDDLSCVDEMAELVLHERFDVVAGSRYMKGGGQKGGPWLKGQLSKLAGHSLHWFTGMPIHDATNNFRMYSRRLLDSVNIESDGGFELALELTVKAHCLNYHLTEVPTTWQDRTAGESRFRLFKWLPKYLRWYFYAMKGKKEKTNDEL